MSENESATDPAPTHAHTAPDLVVIGNMLMDDVVFPDGRTRMKEPGGASLYVALAAALWEARVGIVSVRGTDYPPAALAALERRGVDLSGVRVLDGPGLRTWLLYEEGRRRVVHRLGQLSHLDASPEKSDIPTHCLDARAFHLAPMPIERQLELVKALAPRKEVGISLDPYEVLREDNLTQWRPILEQIDLLFISEDELLLDEVEENPKDALRRLAGGRLRFVAFKRSARGGILYDAREGAFTEWPPVPRLTGDPTGAGDAFAGGFLAAVLQGGNIEDALDKATIAVSFALEDWGAGGLVEARTDDAKRRMREWLGSKSVS